MTEQVGASKWPHCKLEDVCRLVNGRAYKRTELLEEGKYRVLRVGNLFTNNSWFWSDLELDEDKYIDKGDLIYAWSASFGPRIWRGEKVIYHYHIWKCLPDPTLIDKHFLYRLFEWDVAKIKADHGTGSTMIHVTKGDMEARPISLPPLPEQRRIVAKLDRLSARSAAARDHLARTTKLATRAKQAILLELLSGDWQSAWLADLAKVGTGATPKKGTSRFYDGGNIPWVTSGAVNDIRILKAEQFITDAAILETNCKVYPAGTLLMAMYGEGRTRGMVARLEIAAATNQALAAIQINPNAPVRADWVIWVLHSKYLELRELAFGGVQTNLNLGMVKTIEVPIPPLEEQDIRLRKIEAAFARIDRLTEEATRAAHLLDRLDGRLLAKAFRGELVPQDPEDEPAEALLTRIRDARAATPKPKRERRKKIEAE